MSSKLNESKGSEGIPQLPFPPPGFFPFLGEEKTGEKQEQGTPLETAGNEICSLETGKENIEVKVRSSRDELSSSRGRGLSIPDRSIELPVW